MFSSPDARVLLRAVIVFVAVCLASLVQATYGSDLTTNEILVAIASAFTAATGYGGANYLSSSVNPSVGKGS